MRLRLVGTSTAAAALAGALATGLFSTTPVETQGRGPGGAAIVLVDGREAVAGDVLVKFRGSLSTDDQSQLDFQIDADVHEHVGSTGARRMHSRSLNTAALVAFLRSDPRVAYAEPNYIVRAIATPNDPMFGSLWGLLNIGQVVGGVTGVAGADISAVSAWDISTGSRDNVVGVVDTGVDYTHPDLTANVWSAPAAFTVTVGGMNITCAAGTHGFNAVTNTCNPLDDNNHGSHVSGTIGGVGNNGVGVAGVNWTASIMGLKFLDASGSGSTVGAINAIEFAIQAKAVLGTGPTGANVRILSNSWGGGGFSQALLDEINKANANNMLFVAAAGNNAANNDTTAFFPANYNAPNVVSVAATTNTDALASFSNFGATTVHLGAPGQSILSTTRNNTYSSFSGTSMATPHVSGAAALVLSVCNLDTAALKSTIVGNVDHTAAMTGRTISGGRLNVNAAIRTCGTPPAPDFSLSTTPTSQSVVAGAGTSFPVNVARTGGFADAVTLSVAGLPTGAAGTFTPNPATGASSALAVTTSTSTAAGSYTLTVTGVGGGITRTTTATLIVTAPVVQDFSISASPASRNIRHGRSTTYTVTIARTGGFAGAVALTVTGLPTGATGTFNPNNTTGTSSTLTVRTAQNSPRSTFTLTIGGTSGSLSHTTSVLLTVR